MTIINVPLFHFPGSISQQSTGGFTLGTADHHFAMIFRVPKTGTLKKIGWRVYTASAFSGEVRVCVENQKENTTNPVETSYAGKSLYTTSAESAAITSITTAGTRFDAINGSTGISVAKGDRIAVVIRVVSVTSGSFTVSYNQYGERPFLVGSASGDIWSYGYNGSANNYYTPFMTLEYDGEFVPVPFIHPCASANYSPVVFNSGSTYPFIGIKFRAPFGFRAKGCVVNIDADQDTYLHLYGTDGYTDFSGFPMTINSTKRRGSSGQNQYIEFPTEPEFAANTDYYLIFNPSTTTPNITLITDSPADDGAILGMSAWPEGSNVSYAYRGSAPSSGDHTWLNDATKRFGAFLVVNGIDIPAGGSGGGPVMGGMVVR